LIAANITRPSIATARADIEAAQTIIVGAVFIVLKDFSVFITAMRPIKADCKKYEGRYRF
jgi:hypothetical protein